MNNNQNIAQLANLKSATPKIYVNKKFPTNIAIVRGFDIEKPDIVIYDKFVEDESGIPGLI